MCFINHIVYIIEYAHSRCQVLKLKEVDGNQLWFKHAYVRNNSLFKASHLCGLSARKKDRGNVTDLWIHP